MAETHDEWSRWQPSQKFCRRFSQFGRHDFVIYESDISKERTVKRSLVAFHIVKCNKSNELIEWANVTRISVLYIFLTKNGENVYLTS